VNATPEYIDLAISFVGESRSVLHVLHQISELPGKPESPIVSGTKFLTQPGWFNSMIVQWAKRYDVAYRATPSEDTELRADLFNVASMLSSVYQVPFVGRNSIGVFNLAMGIWFSRKRPDLMRMFEQKLLALEATVARKIVALPENADRPPERLTPAEFKDLSRLPFSEVSKNFKDEKLRTVPIARQIRRQRDGRRKGGGRKTEGGNGGTDDVFTQYAQTREGKDKKAGRQAP
jgi:hypothetical protein